MSSNSITPPPQIMEQMEAGAFRELCQHLRDRSDQVQNIDLMTLSGFCRNCLAKWMVLEARQLSETLRAGNSPHISFANDEHKQIAIAALDAYGYDEAAKEVYGCTYLEWKKRHQTKATDEQVRLYQESASIHALHDDDILEKKRDGVACDLAVEVLIRLQAGAFRSLCQHLRERSDEVQNIDLMGLSGFCRNCLAKWLVVQARKISKEVKNSDIIRCYFIDQQQSVVETLDGYDYDEAALVVYGCGYPEWKKLHMKKATVAQMERFNASKYLHAKHDKDLLEPRVTLVSRKQDNPTSDSITSKTCTLQTTHQQSLLSNVCCEDIENIAASNSVALQKTVLQPPTGNMNLKVAILTVSDRAAANKYSTGDLSGPSVKAAIERQIGEINLKFGGGKITISQMDNAIVPDDTDEIKTVLLEWSGKSQANTGYDIIFTTGGTGFATRDVTPEATNSVLDRKCHGLMSWASVELTARQPLATLSRASAGTCGKSIIINLPGSPTGASEVVELLFPLLLHAVKDVNLV